MSSKYIKATEVFRSTVSPKAWFDFKEGIKLQLAFVPKAKFREISDDSLEWVFDEKTKTRQQKLSSKKFQDKFLRVAVLDWEGVTLESLSRIAEIDTTGYTPEQLKEVIPFSHEWIVELEKVAYDLDQFITSIVSDIKQFRPNLENEIKNSVSSPSTS